MGAASVDVTTAALAVLAGLGAAVTGLVIGRAVPKDDPVGDVCSSCDGLIVQDELPSLLPRACPECGRTVRGPATVIVVAVTSAIAALYGLGDRGWLLLANCILGGSLAALVWTDARYRVLPGRLVWAATGVSLGPLALAGAASADDHFQVAVVVAGLSGLAFGGLHLLSPSGMAFGDVRLAVLLGLHLGWRSAEAVLWAFLVATSIGWLVGRARERATGASTVPFGPFMAIGTVVALLASAQGVS